MLLSQVAAWAGWSVTKRVLAEGTVREVSVQAVGLLEPEGLWWVVGHLVENFVSFPPLGVVLVGMLGIGVAERAGLIRDLLGRLLQAAPATLLTPATVLVGVLSSAALDAGYVVLPPLAAVLYQAAGRSPVTGIAAVTAGVTAGFSANLFITPLDPLLAGFTTLGARVLDSGYQVATTANWYFMIASTVLLTLTGWGVTVLAVQGRAAAHAPAAGQDPTKGADTATDPRALRTAGWSALVLLAAVLALILVPGAALHGQGTRFARWMEAIVPLLFVVFLVPGVAYGVVAGTIRSARDVAEMMADTLRGLAPYIALAFFAAQFIALFNHSRLGEMLAIAGGQALAQADLPASALVLAFVVVVMLGNLLMGSASAKYAFFAPVFVPMFMQVGVSPELTQAAYRVGDSVSNGITPLNPYLIIILATLQRYVPKAGLGTLVALMLPYTVGFLAVWSALLLVWILGGWALGPGGPLTYTPGI
jgi:aminobenzoyl-glutamate transport protein